MKTKKIAAGFYEILGTTKPLYLVKDAAKRVKWGGSPDWDVLYPCDPESVLPITEQDMDLLLTAKSKEAALIILETLKERL